MGNLCGLLSPEPVKSARPTSSSKARPPSPPSVIASLSNRWSKLRSSSSSSRKDNRSIQEQALAAAIILQHRRQNGKSTPVDRSSSLRYTSPSGPKKQGLPRSCSSRARSVTDPLLQPHQLLNQDVKLDELETNHLVLVHGGGFGAWCCEVTSISQYVKPLTDHLEKLANDEKVILVGHDFGGTCISYAMELFPSKITKAVFIAAAMLRNGQSTLDMWSQQAASNDLMQKAQIFLYANGKDQPPTAIDLDKSFLSDLLFNQSPAKDVALAAVSMRPIPFKPVLEKLSLSDVNYGSVRRFYIETPEDNAISVELQDNMIKLNPPERVFRLKGADHSPFFSKPQALHKLLVEISKIHPLDQVLEKDGLG
ncbi:hypothetical protein EUGRSUZ_J01386 [Eucalyptus grandis]|uniref:AB hydrolase-1 domain-containing protein n=3 Tax=Eucalyptus grandis TaxID=71139 RepID=A0A059ADR2_EUCGR|nr:hypothetical protein EUGRSUZ_J01386 [Eucalyptus grandis]KAK3409250.1 hypothetical protein EUGRSUZ_J01386 [Eucalyptus grandis]